MKKYFILFILFFINSCEKSPTEYVGDFIISDKDEVQLGANYHKEIEASDEYPLAKTTNPLTIYVNEIGQKLLSANIGNPGFRDPDKSIGFDYTFSVINTDVVNAFATPGGYIYIYRGVIDNAKNEAELACIIAHEMGHVVKKHFKSQYIQSYTTQQISEMILGKGLLSNAVTFFANNKYSRTDEFEADSCAVVFSAAANYNSYALIGFFKTLNSLAGGSGNTGLLKYFSSHPDTDDRIAAVKSHLKRKYPEILESDTATYYTENFNLKTGK